jgi:hypothetical protein
LIVESDNGSRPLSKVSQRWGRRLAKRKALKDDHHAKNQVINKAINKVRSIEEAMLDLGATSNFVQLADGFELTDPSSESVSNANGHIMKATNTALLPLKQL